MGHKTIFAALLAFALIFWLSAAAFAVEQAPEPNPDQPVSSPEKPAGEPEKPPLPPPPGAEPGPGPQPAPGVEPGAKPEKPPRQPRERGTTVRMPSRSANAGVTDEQKKLYDEIQKANIEFRKALSEIAKRMMQGQDNAADEAAKAKFDAEIDAAITAAVAKFLEAETAFAEKLAELLKKEKDVTITERAKMKKQELERQCEMMKSRRQGMPAPGQAVPPRPPMPGPSGAQPPHEGEKPPLPPPPGAPKGESGEPRPAPPEKPAEPPKPAPEPPEGE